MSSPAELCCKARQKANLSRTGCGPKWCKFNTRTQFCTGGKKLLVGCNHSLQQVLTRLLLSIPN